jgi:hypothetical protein
LCDVLVWRSTKSDDFEPLWIKVKLPKSYEAEIAPKEVIFLEIDKTE